ncbi:MAG: exo-beta-N-acetylmuramidase NamZ domain-containing protein [Candidatus Acidiferrales bacterium]
MFPSHRAVLAIFLAVLSATVLFAQAPRPARATGEANISVSAQKLAELDDVVHRSIDNGEIPGAVLVVGQRGRVIYRKAFGDRAILPAREPMTPETIFDLASLTKVIATAPAIVKLVEDGKLRINDPVVRYLPEFASHGKDQITLRMLLTHTAGLAPDPPISAAQAGAAALWKEICDESLLAPPGMRFEYSDTGYIVLGKLVERVAGEPLDRYADGMFYGPLRMTHTRFLPPKDWIPQIAPTEEIDLPPGEQPGSGKGHVLRGEVHDPTARAMGGVAGNAGLFSSADDLARFCQMMLDDGAIAGGPSQAAVRRIFSAETVERMILKENPPWVPSLRGYGWDIDSTFSSPRGELFPIGSYGHTGFTGTSVWIDPESRTFVVLLTNSVHPYRRPAISSLRSKVATVVAASVGVSPNASAPSAIERGVGAGHSASGTAPLPANVHTQTGIDVLEAQHFAPLQGKHVGLITNQTGIDSLGRRTIDVLAKAEGVKLVALFSPEHGIEGLADSQLKSSTDAATGLPVYSLYSDTRRPTPEMLRGVDALVFDIQDAGVRFYTYTAAMGFCMEEAAAWHIPFFVLDRPNPLGGEVIEGPMLDPGRLSYTAYFPMPVRYAMTLGELAQMFNAENKIGADLHVIAMNDWPRSATYDVTGLLWLPTSPNLRTLNASLIYPGIEILQAGGVSVGRGTNTPLEILGAPWAHARELADALNQRFIPGVRFVPTRFVPNDGLYKGQLCEGVSVIITDRQSLNSMLMGLEIASTLWKLYPDQFAIDRTLVLLGSGVTVELLKQGTSPAAIMLDWSADIDAFRAIRAKYLIYR